jgi:glutaredoxin
METELVMYTRSTGCPFVTLATRVLDESGVPYREIYIDKNPIARDRVRDWTGFLSVPTLVVAAPGEDLPIEVPPPLPEGKSPQGIDRDTMITEPREPQLRAWLQKNGFINA